MAAEEVLAEALLGPGPRGRRSSCACRWVGCRGRRGRSRGAMITGRLPRPRGRRSRRPRDRAIRARAGSRSGDGRWWGNSSSTPRGSAGCPSGRVPIEAERDEQGRIRTGRGRRRGEPPPPVVERGGGDPLARAEFGDRQAAGGMPREGDGGRSQVLMLGLAGLAVSIVLAWLIGRGIAGPVVRMATAMHAVAAGDTSVAIPGVGRRDEIGEMADNVQVFKDNLIETERLRVEHERVKAEAEAARRQGMLQLASEFESGILGVVASVAAQATEMQSAAQSMADTAQGATMQATAVAAAVEQASTNVQTVASSARGARGLGARDRPAGGALLHDRRAGGGRGRPDQCLRRGPEPDRAADRRRGPADRDASRPRPTCWRSMPPSRRHAPAMPARASRWSPPR